MDVINSGIDVIRSIIALERAFDELRATGIMAEQDFLCCSTCGRHEFIKNRVPSDSRTGYVFYHGQAAEGLLESGEVYLNFGAFEDKDDCHTAVGNKVFEVLKKHGFKVTWSGDHNTCISVVVIEPLEFDEEDDDDNDE